MGELIRIQQPARVSRHPAWRLSGFGILGSSKGQSYATGGSPPPAPGPTAVALPSGSGADMILRQLDAIARPDQPVRMTATGEPLAPSKDARTLPRRFPAPAPQAPVQHVIGMPVAWPFSNPWAHPWSPPGNAAPTIPTAAPGAPFPGSGGGGGGAADSSAADAAADPAVFLGLTQKQLLIGGAVALGAWLLLRKKGGGAPAPSESVI